MKKILVVLIMVMVVIGFNAEVINAEGELASKTIRVRVNIPVMQEMEVIRPVVVNTNEIFAGNDSNQVVIKEAGSVRVRSNASWRLQVSNRSFTGNQVMVRQTGQSDSDWQPLADGRGIFSGSHGTEVISFDLKILETEGKRVSSNDRIVFDYMLVQN